VEEKRRIILDASPQYVMLAALINTGAVIYILYKQFLSLREDPPSV
jgi:hypothetical protein